ncbi:MAG: PEGA domain-containing protein [Lentisphaerae bacterium]|jgi:TolB protein|nr:PEGA domain-containing protein [Lentisphaerota bacterium]
MRLTSYSFFMLFLLLFAGCRTVTVSTIPANATIRQSVNVLSSPAKVTTWLGSPKVITIEATGHTTETRTLELDSEKAITVILNRSITVTSAPAGANILLDGNPVGTAPVTLQIPADKTSCVLVAEMKNHSRYETTFNPQTSRDEIVVALQDLGPGNTTWILQPAKYGRPKLIPKLLPASEDTREPRKQQPEQITSLDKTQLQIIDFIILDDSSIVATVLTQDKNDSMNLELVQFQAGQKASQALTNGNFDFNPVLSVDGKSLYFTSNRTGRLDLWSMELATKKMALIHSSDIVILNPAPRPNAQTILFTAINPAKLNEPQIWTYNANSKNAAPPEYFLDGAEPKWAPNAKQFTIVKNNPAQIWRLEFDGSLPTKISPDAKGVFAISPTWSPDSKRIAFATNLATPDRQDQADIWIMDADGKNLRQITTNPAFDDKPAFTPDGNHIVFRSNRGKYWNLWKIPLN